MKTIKLCLVLLVFTASCATNPTKTAYNTIGTLGITANAAIGAYTEYISTHEVSNRQILTARKAVKGYVLAMDSAQAAITVYQTAKSPATEQLMKDSLDNLSNVVTDLQTLLTTIQHE